MSPRMNQVPPLPPVERRGVEENKHDDQSDGQGALWSEYGVAYHGLLCSGLKVTISSALGHPCLRFGCLSVMPMACGLFRERADSTGRTPQGEHVGSPLLEGSLFVIC